MLSRRQRTIQRLYSTVAEKIYEPVVVQGTFKLFGGNLHALLEDQAPDVARAAAGGPLLDIPVGTAYFTRALAEAHSGYLVGADIAFGMLQKSATEARRKGFRLGLLQGDIHRLPFPTGTFPAIACTNGLQVIPGLDGSLAELARVLRPGGTIFISVITLGLSKLTPRAADRLPTIFRSGDHVADSVSAAGLEVVTMRKERRATLIEAQKPAN